MAVNPLILIPTRNEAGNIRQLLEELSTLQYKVIVDDGGSTDNTPGIALQCGATVYPRPPEVGPLGWLFNRKHTLWSWKQHGYTHVITMDAGGTHSPCDVPRFVEKAAQGCDLVLGVRMFRPTGKLRTSISMTAALLMKVPDATCGFRCYDLGLAYRLPMMYNKTGFTFHFVALSHAQRLGASIGAVPIKYVLNDSTSFKWKTLAQAAIAYCIVKSGGTPTC